MFSPSPSLTAIGVTALRALYANLPEPLCIVDDPFAADLLPLRSRAWSLLRTNPALGRFVHRSLRLLTRDLSLSTPLRTVVIDQAVRAAVDGGARQLVLLGSGLDARSWRCPELNRVDVFELDREKTHRYKRRHLGAREPLARSHRFIPLDFAKDDLGLALLQAGFRAEAPSVWVWEGVIIYLPLEAVSSTIRRVAELSAPGSTLIATYTCPGLGLNLPTLRLRMAARLIGEPLRGLMTTQRLHALLGEHGFDAAIDEPVSRWAFRALPSTEVSTGPDWERLAIATRR